MNTDQGGNGSLPRYERGKVGPAVVRRPRRGARNMVIGGRGAGEAKSRNKTWRREDTAPTVETAKATPPRTVTPFGAPYGINAYVRAVPVRV